LLRDSLRRARMAEFDPRSCCADWRRRASALVHKKRRFSMPEVTTNSTSAVLGRLFWMMIGPLFLGISAYYIVTAGTGWATAADLMYFLVLGGMILGRWLEFRGGNPRNSTGEPCAPGDLRRYVVLTIVIGVAVWVLTNAIGNHLLGG
jgi:hypothetical protein